MALTVVLIRCHLSSQLHPRGWWLSLEPPPVPLEGAIRLEEIPSFLSVTEGGESILLTEIPAEGANELLIGLLERNTHGVASLLLNVIVRLLSGWVKRFNQNTTPFGLRSLQTLTHITLGGRVCWSWETSLLVDG